MYRVDNIVDERLVVQEMHTLDIFLRINFGHESCSLTESSNKIVKKSICSHRIGEKVDEKRKWAAVERSITVGRPKMGGKMGAKKPKSRALVQRVPVDL